MPAWKAFEHFDLLTKTYSEIVQKLPNGVGNKFVNVLYQGWVFWENQAETLWFAFGVSETVGESRKRV